MPAASGEILRRAVWEERDDLINRAFRDLNERDWDDLRTIMRPDFEFHSTFAALEGRGVYRGIDEFLELISSFLATWDELAWHPEEVKHGGKASAIFYRVTGVAKGSGVPLVQNLVMVWTWDNGSPTRGEVFTDPKEALAAAGLSD
jgi:ketosteroid isomerase-like protein